MKEKSVSKVVNLIKSMKLRVFLIVAVAIIIPIMVSSLFLTNIAVNNFMNNKIDRFKANNTMLKNSIISEGYIEKNDSAVVNTQIEQLAKEYNCRIEVINSFYTIIKDTDSSEQNKTSISENVIRCLKGENIYIKNTEDNYVEFAVPLTTNTTNPEGKTKTSVIGALYINYSIADVDTYNHNLYRYVIMIDCLLYIFSLLAAWLCSVLFTRPIKRIENSIEKISKGQLDEVERKDYSEIEKISGEFTKMVERINTQEKSRQEFVSNVSHELKTPITSMKVLADSLLGQEGMPEELYQEFLQDISKEIDRENEIITDLLDLVKMEKSETEINISSVNINEILEAVLKRLKPIAATKNIELVFESFRPVIADVDEIKFASVVTNLVENAIKYNNTDGTVTASLNSDHQYFYLKVTDTGIGISETDQERVFERFFRVDKARARETGGTGLGLAITKEIVLKHHGSIKIHSKEGEGTTFTVRIPLKYIQ
ncbi:MAG: ATP-binding protein [Eubacterium sp.]